MMELLFFISIIVVAILIIQIDNIFRVRPQRLAVMEALQKLHENQPVFEHKSTVTTYETKEKLL